MTEGVLRTDEMNVGSYSRCLRVQSGDGAQPQAFRSGSRLKPLTGNLATLDTPCTVLVHQVGWRRSLWVKAKLII